MSLAPVIWYCFGVEFELVLIEYARGLFGRISPDSHMLIDVATLVGSRCGAYCELCMDSSEVGIILACCSLLQQLACVRVSMHEICRMCVSLELLFVAFLSRRSITRSTFYAFLGIFVFVFSEVATRCCMASTC